MSLKIWITTLLAVVLFVPSEPEVSVSSDIHQPEPCTLDSVDSALTRYLRAEPAELAKRAGDGRIGYAQGYVNCLGEVLGALDKESDQYPIVKGKQAYFRGVIARMQAENVVDADRIAAEGYLTSAEVELNAALEVLQNAAYVINELGIVYQTRGGKSDLETAQNLYQRARGAAPDWAMPIVNQANTILAINPENYSPAANLYKEALKLRKDLAVAHLGLGNIEVSSKSTRTDGLAHLRRAFVSLPNIPETQYGYARGLIKADSQSRGVRLYRSAAELDNRRLRGKASYALGYYLYRQSPSTNPRAAAKQFKKAATSFDGNTEMLRHTYRRIGLVYGGTRATRQGLRHQGRRYLASEKNRHELPEIFAGRAGLRALGWKNEVRREINEKGSRDFDFVQDIAVALYQNDQYDQAEKVAEIGVEQFPNEWRAYHTLIDIQLELNRTRRACRTVAEARASLGDSWPKLRNELQHSQYGDYYDKIKPCINPQTQSDQNDRS
jgi:tetratricopeptide (TPR) repeat protein